MGQQIWGENRLSPFFEPQPKLGSPRPQNTPRKSLGNKPNGWGKTLLRLQKQGIADKGKTFEERSPRVLSGEWAEREIKFFLCPLSAERVWKHRDHGQGNDVLQSQYDEGAHNQVEGARGRQKRMGR